MTTAASSPRQRAIADAARIIASLPLRTARPATGVLNCPVDFGVEMRLTFRTCPDGPVVARLTAGYGGCGVVSVRIEGKSMPALSGYTPSGQQLQQRVLAIAGVSWPYQLGLPWDSAG